jgi:hypothetical protein
MDHRLFGFLDHIVRQPYGSVEHAAPRMEIRDIEKLLTDDGPRRLSQAGIAAVEWDTSETVDHVEIVTEHMLVTPDGLLYAATLRSRCRPLYYLAMPPASFDAFVDRVRATPRIPNSAAAVESRLGHNLDFPWPLDGDLRRTLDSNEVLIGF